MDTGNIYFHFNGTNDGNWVYNAAVYGVEPQPSDLQKGCLLWFDMTMEKLKEKGIINDTSVIYVTGHSQGGNNAMFVTMRSKYGDDIDACIPLDGPDFSNKFVDDTIEMLGESEFNKRCDKIWAYTGENDYVDFLGQISIVPEGHTKYVKYSKSEFDFTQCHSATGMVDEKGKMTIVDTDSEFRRLLYDLVKQIPDLPQEDQLTVALNVMAICENYITGDKEFRTAEISPEGIKATLEILKPLLVDFLKDHPNEIAKVLEDNFKVDTNIASGIADIIELYGRLEKKDREAFLDAIFDLIKVENNEISIDLTKLAESYDVLSDAIEKMVFSDPNTIHYFLEEHGITSAPIQYASTIFAIAIWKGTDKFLEISTNVIDAAITIYKALTGVYEKAADILVGMFESVKKVINNIKDLWYQKNNNGIAYVQRDPYFKADTDKLREYAARLERVNNRLRKLDSNMRGLYWQVGLLDLWDILIANMITSKSYAIDQAKKYLYNTAERLENAENKAKNYIGG
ncbi:MAG: DUF2974 domain-containing protein [Eubacterium sp.]|nr:DUF2974 domain-containing protein [Eubacterium sp.]